MRVLRFDQVLFFFRLQVSFRDANSAAPAPPSSAPGCSHDAGAMDDLFVGV